MQVAHTPYMPVQAFGPSQASQQAGYRASYIWFNILIAVGLIAVFNYVGTSAATPIVVVWCLYLIFTLSQRFQASIPLLFLAACYERPILDFGLGIFATIKLFDIVALAVVVAAVRLPLSQRKKLPHDSLFLLSTFVILIALTSAAVLFIQYSGTRFELARLSILYAIKMIEYGLVLNALRSVILRQVDIVRALNFFLLGLSVVFLIAVLQGMGLVPNQYYTSHTGSMSWINSAWAISILGPNHSHLGSYAVLGVFLATMLMQVRFRLLLLIPVILGLGALFYSHSATGIAMLAFLMGISLFFSNFGNKLLLVAMGGIVVVAMAIYFSGRLGGDQADVGRSQRKLLLEGQSGILHRMFIRPPALISNAISKEPGGIIFGWGFRSPRTVLPDMPNLGDHNYMAVFVDVGVVGFVAYMGCLLAFYKKLVSASKQSFSDQFMNIYAKSAILFFWAVLLAMLGQEVLWPIHSRGNTFPIFLIFMALPFFYYESQRMANAYSPR